MTYLCPLGNNFNLYPVDSYKHYMGRLRINDDTFHNHVCWIPELPAGWDSNCDLRCATHAHDYGMRPFD